MAHGKNAEKLGHMDKFRGQYEEVITQERAPAGAERGETMEIDKILAEMKEGKLRKRELERRQRELDTKLKMALADAGEWGVLTPAWLRAWVEGKTEMPARVRVRNVKS